MKLDSRLSRRVCAAVDLLHNIQEDGTTYLTNGATGTVVRGAESLEDRGVIERIQGEQRRHYMILDINELEGLVNFAPYIK